MLSFQNVNKLLSLQNVKIQNKILTRILSLQNVNRMLSLQINVKKFGYVGVSSRPDDHSS